MCFSNVCNIHLLGVFATLLDRIDIEHDLDPFVVWCYMYCSMSIFSVAINVTNVIEDQHAYISRKN